ncbi:putative zinc-binding metallopeptidase [uncultured Amphritea sp.]|uniref:zinc-binding metallopeptidase family protein n=1 Tax=uncultured Amphritea sp. TaxID=981605 RepID=UPI00262EB5D0|nr:putative zinc-binding metallopeptidase [uncultured Amphritea sp.]
MQIFQCGHCEHVILFENVRCERCKNEVAFEPKSLRFITVTEHNGNLIEINKPQGFTWKYCKNKQQQACNWLVDSDSASRLCISCELNRYIPNIGTIENLDGWRSLQFAKHRLVYSLLKHQLPVDRKQAPQDSGISFDFINTTQVVPKDAHTMTGHDGGKITITMNEANSVQREQARVDMHEHYRTLLGHLRHEVGHYYWDLLIRDNPVWLERYRAEFGDERQDYSQALQRHYDNGPVPDWSQHYVTEYASSHPWEDWAETWSHYLHLTDIMETATALRVSVNPDYAEKNQGLAMTADIDPYGQVDFDAFLSKALAVIFSANCLNRSMGQPDLYPFVLMPRVKEKLRFIHELLKERI